MTPKQKAEKLINDIHDFSFIMNEGSARDLAVFCVNEILASSDHAGGGDDYWSQVLSHLQNNMK